MPNGELVEEELTNLGVSTAKGAVGFVTSFVVKSVILLLVLAILARLLEPTLFGFYTIVFAIYTLIETIGYFGMGATLRKKLATLSGDAAICLINNAYFASFTVAIIMLVLIFFSSNYIAVNIYHNSALSLPIVVVSVSLLADVMFNVTCSSLLGLRKSKEASMSYMALAFTYLIASPGLVLLGYGITGAIVGLLLGYVAGFLISYFYLMRFIRFRISRPRWHLVKEMLGFSAPIFISNIGTSMAANFGVLLLGVFASAAIVGNYGVASKLGSFVSVILVGSTSVLLPTFSHISSRKKLSTKMGSIYNNSLYYTLLFLLPLLAYAISIAVPLMAVLFSYAYKAAPLYFTVIATGITIGVIGSYGGMLLVSYGEVKRFMKYQVSVALAEVGLMVLLIPYFQAIGLLISLFVAGPILFDIIYISVLSKRFDIRIKRIARTALASAIMFVILGGVTMLLHQSRVSLVTNLLLLVLLYPPLLALLGGIKKKNLEFIRRVSYRVRGVDWLVSMLVAYTEKFVKN